MTELIRSVLPVIVAGAVIAALGHIFAIRQKHGELAIAAEFRDLLPSGPRRADAGCDDT